MTTLSSAHRRVRRNWSERGAAAVEFALIVPALMLLVFGITEFGRAYYFQTSLTNAAREGARAAALTSGTTTTPVAAATPAAQNATTLSGATVSVSQTNGSSSLNGSLPCQTGYTVTVTMTYPMAFLTSLFGSDFTVTGKASMRCGG